MTITKRMTMHSIGPGFSELQYKIAVDGMKTDLRRTVRTSGSPDFETTQDTYYHKDKTFDNLAGTTDQRDEWILGLNLACLGPIPTNKEGGRS